ncbi:MAG: 4-demethylwyosine synthase TYW1 [Methanomicrobiales archaeon]|nr:4-demethylwyosine synthase TYW1 [Methanomicrobiales archaeon]
MLSVPCDALRRQGYQFFSTRSSAAVKPCLWCKSDLRSRGACYKYQFYGIESYRCVQMTPTLRCTQRCLYCWRSFEHEVTSEEEIAPEEIVSRIADLQKRAIAGFKVSSDVSLERFSEAARPKHVAISLAGEPTCYSHLPELIDLFHHEGCTTFLVSNGTRPWVLEHCRPTQMYLSLSAPDQEIYRRLCRPKSDASESWERVQESLDLLGGRRSAVRITLIHGINDCSPERYAAMVQDSGAMFVEVKGYMYLGFSRRRMRRENMPEHHEVRRFAEEISKYADYCIADENEKSRVALLRRCA